MGQAGPQSGSGFPGLEADNAAVDFSGGGRVDVPTADLPTGHAARTIEGWFNGGNSGPQQSFFYYGGTTDSRDQIRTPTTIVTTYIGTKYIAPCTTLATRLSGE